jgi:hypothetical protein
VDNDRAQEKFLLRMTHRANERQKRREDKQREKEYEAVRNKKKCPECGACQTFEEVQQRKKRCGSCNKLYRHAVMWHSVREEFFDRNVDNVRTNTHGKAAGKAGISTTARPNGRRLHPADLQPLPPMTPLPPRLNFRRLPLSLSPKARSRPEASSNTRAVADSRRSGDGPARRRISGKQQRQGLASPSRHERPRAPAQNQKQQRGRTDMNGRMVDAAVAHALWPTQVAVPAAVGFAPQAACAPCHLSDMALAQQLVARRLQAVSAGAHAG